MKKVIKGKIFIILMLLLLFFAVGCAKEEKQFDFSNVEALRLYQGDDRHYVEIMDAAKIQEIMKQVSDIVWQERSEAEISPWNDDWEYRLQCFSRKGEKKQNIYLNAVSTIGYKSQIWDAEDEAELDFSVYEEYFRQEAGSK